MSEQPPAEPSERAVEIEQRRLLRRRRAECVDDGVVCDYEAPFKQVSYKVRYEDVATDPIEFTDEPSWQPIALSFVLGVGSLFFFFLGFSSGDHGTRMAARIVGLLLVVAAGLSWLAGHWPRRQLLQLSMGDPALLLFAERPSSTDVAAFLSGLRERRDAYLRKTYGSADPRGSKVDLIERLFSLKQAGALSEAEYDDLKSEILGSGEAYGASGQYL